MELITDAKDERCFPIQFERGYPHPHPSTVPWAIAELAYSQYVSRHGRCQTLERLLERGGFAPSEMDTFLPDWKERVDANVRLRADLSAALERERVMREKLISFVEWLELNGHGDGWHRQLSHHHYQCDECRRLTDARAMSEYLKEGE